MYYKTPSTLTFQDIILKINFPKLLLEIILIESIAVLLTAKAKSVPLHAMKAFGLRQGIAPTHS
jgi:hypothetical protein